MFSPSTRRYWLALALAAPLAQASAGDYVSPAQARLKADVAFLADDDREGRGPGTKGIDAAADHIAASFKDTGLKPAPGADGYFQHFDLGEERKPGEPLKLAVSVGKGDAIEAQAKKEFVPMDLGGGGEVKGLPLIFAGYGITAKDEAAKLDYDDYAGVDAKDKAVLIIRRRPQQDKEEGPFGHKGENSSYAMFNHKLGNASSHGVKAVLLVNDGTMKEKDDLLEYGSTGGSGTSKVVFVMVSRAFADKLLKAAGQPDLAALEADIDSDLKPRSRVLEGALVDATVTVERKALKVKNVIGVLEGSGPHADETIVVGAHYDHLGYGGFGSMAFGNRSIHNGADDNASGTATMMEMARRLARRADPLPRRVVFMAYSAEERGLIGSDYYVKNPLFPLDKTVAMVNFDMVGRLNEASDLLVYGAGSSPGMDTLVESLAKDQGLKPKTIVGTGGEFAASDHYSFYRKDIPVVFFFTGTHADYHRPSDDTNLINFEGMAKVADVGELLLLDLIRRPERPKFEKLVSKAPAPGAGSASRGSGVYLGTRPSYADAPEGGGVKLDGVTEGSPAEKGGMKAGDVITKFDGKDVKDIDAYMAAMSTRKPGDEVEIIVRREGKDTPLKVKLGSRPGSGRN